MKLGPEFDRLLAVLTRRWKAYDDAPRDPGRVTELTAAWLGLDDARRDIGAERARLRPEPPEPAIRRARRVAVDPDAYRRLSVRNYLPQS